MKKFRFYYAALVIETILLIALPILINFVWCDNGVVSFFLMFLTTNLLIFSIILTFAPIYYGKIDEQRELMISKFNLEKGKYVEVTPITLPNSIISLEAIKRTLKDLISLNSKTLPDKYVNVSYFLDSDKDEILAKFFTGAMKEFGAKFYLYLDHKETISLCITTYPENELWLYSFRFGRYQDFPEFFKNFKSV